MLLAKKRMAIKLPVLDTRPTRVFPFDWAVVGFATLLCLSLRMTSAGLLVASVEREDGRVVACRYFTGTHVVERQHAVGAGGVDRHFSCPLIRTRSGHPVLP